VNKRQVLVAMVLLVLLGACATPRESMVTGELYDEPPCWYHVESCPEGPTGLDEGDRYCEDLEAGTGESAKACRSELLSQLKVLVTRLCEGREACEVEIIEGLNNGEVWLTQEGAYRVGN
jgi:hypothetical protein